MKNPANAGEKREKVQDGDRRRGHFISSANVPKISEVSPYNAYE